MTFRDDNGQVLQFDGTFALTKKAASFFDFKIAGDVSINFTVSNNSINRKALGYYGPMMSEQVAFTRQRFTLIDENGNQVARGFIVISEDIGDMLDCYFVSGNSNWFHQLQANITDYLYEDYVLLSSAVDTQKAATEGIIFPVVDWSYDGLKLGNNFVSSTIGLISYLTTPLFQEMFPCFYLNSITKEIAKNTGLKFAGTLFDDQTYKSIIVTPRGPNLQYPSKGIDETVAFARRSADVALSAAAHILPFDQVVSQGSKGNYDNVNYRYNMDRTATMKITITFNASVNQAYALAVFVNGVSVAPGIGGTSTNAVFDFVYINVRRGDYIEVRNSAVGAGFNLLSTSTVRYEIQKELPSMLRYGTSGLINTYYNPAAIIPEITGIEFVKFLTMYFGCVCTFDEYSNTITINKLDKITDSEDWSQYFVGFKADYSQGIGTNNYIRTQEPKEQVLIDYNAKSLVPYGGGNIQTDYTNTLQTDLYTIPFAPAYDRPSRTTLNWFLPFIKFYDLQPDNLGLMTVTTVDLSGGFARFNGSNTGILTGDVVNVVSSTGIYTGIGVVSGASSTVITIYGVPFTITDTATITKMKFSPVTGANRLLYCLPGFDISGAGDQTSFTFKYDAGLASSVSSSKAAVAFYDKPKINDSLDLINQSLAISNIPGKEFNNTIDDQYYNTLKKIFNRPKLIGKFILPLDVFTKYKFDKRIYLLTPDLSGYFFPDSIDNFHDGMTELEVPLYML